MFLKHHLRVAAAVSVYSVSIFIPEKKLYVKIYLVVNRGLFYKSVVFK